MFVGYVLRRMIYTNEEDIPCSIPVPLVLFRLNNDAHPHTMHFLCDDCQSRPMNRNDLLHEQAIVMTLTRSKHTILLKEGQLVWYYHFTLQCCDKDSPHTPTSLYSQGQATRSRRTQTSLAIIATIICRNLWLDPFLHLVFDEASNETDAPKTTFM